MLDIEVKGNIKEWTKHMNYVQRQQIPFATSRAINDSAVRAQQSVVSQIQRVFNNKKRWWLKRQPTGIKVDFSNKRYLVASVFTRAPFAWLQEKGGAKTPKQGRNLAIPTEKVPKRYRKSTGLRDMKAANKKVFVNEKGAFRRRSKKKIELLWSFAPRAFVKPRFGFERAVRVTVERFLPVYFSRRMKEALRTAK